MTSFHNGPTPDDIFVHAMSDHHGSPDLGRYPITEQERRIALELAAAQGLGAVVVVAGYLGTPPSTTR